MEILIATSENGGLEFIYCQAKREGWEPGPQDALIFSCVDPNGFFIGRVNNKIVCCVSAVRFSDFAFIGYYIVVPEERGKGYGLKLFQHALSHLSSYNIGLDAALEQELNYQKSGFKSFHTNMRFKGKVAAFDGFHQLEGGVLVPLSEVPVSELQEYDRKLFLAGRDPWLQKWQDGSIDNANAIACISVLETGQKVLGFGVVRPCVSGYKLAPLYADSGSVAACICQALLCRLDHGQTFFLDVPDRNERALQLVEALHMEKVFECRRMWTIDEPEGGLWSEIYSLSSLELG